jgi:myo-inositol-1(or 4)-monophosphatase
MTDRDLELRLLTACAVAREAGHLARDFFIKRAELEVEHKTGVQDLVSIADREVEELIRTRLSVAFPEDRMLGEEGGGDGLLEGDADPLDGDAGLLDDALDEPRGAGEPAGERDQSPRGLWVIDPIDGTANFLRGMPYWSVALAYLVEGRTEIGVTYDPVHDELFWARRGTGAYRNERAIRVSGGADPKRAVLGSTFTFKMKVEDYLAMIEGILRAGADHRRMGSTALMMCHVADGRLDGCATLYCNSWDVIGGLLLVREAGGAASDFLDGATLTEPNRAFGCTPDLTETIAGLTGANARI